MPIQTSRPFAQQYTQEDIPAAASDVRGATWDQALSDLPGASLIRSFDLSFARSITAADKYSPAEAAYFMEERGLKDRFQFDRDYNILELELLAKRKQAEVKRQEILARAEGSGSTAPGRFAIALASNLLDPIAIGTSFVPVVGQSRYGVMLERAGSALGRAGVRARVGALEGAVGSALVEPIIAGAKAHEQADYTFVDSFMNLTIGTVFGGGLHTTAGAIGDAVRARRPSQELLEDAQRAVPEQVASDAPAQTPRADPLSGPLDVPDQYYQAARELSSAMYRARDVDLSNPAAISRIAGREVESVSQFVKRTGGIADEGGELSARDVTNKSLPGLVRKAGTKGADMDAVRERLFDAGYFPSARSYNDISDSEIFDAIANDLAGERVYPAAFADLVARLHQEKDFAERLASQGVTRDMEIGDIAARLRELDDEAHELSREDPELVDPFSEYEAVRAREVVAAADLPTREAALRAVVGQAAAGEAIEARPFFDRSSMLEAARRMADPDQLPLSDPGAVRRADQVLEAGEVAEIKAVQNEVAGLEAQISSILEDEQLDAPDFGLPAMPRTIADDDELLKPRDTDTSPEREAMRTRIVESQLEHAVTVEGRKPIAYLMGGGGASGKGTILKRLTKAGVVPRDGAVHVDPDEIKRLIPEFDEIVKRGDSRAAAVVHEESSALAKRVIAAAIEKKSDLVLDRTLANEAKGLAEIEALKAAGYEVRLYGVTVDPVNAIRRADARARKSGRYVPPQALLAAHKGFAGGFEALARAVDEAVLFNNEVPQGAAPVVLARRDSGKDLKIEDEEGYTAFRERSQINTEATTAREVRSETAPAAFAQRGDSGGLERDAGADARGDGGQGQGSRNASDADRLSAERLEALPQDLREELAAADEAISQAKDLSRAAQMMAACATRSAA